MVVLDCSALPTELAEAAIRGHAKGAFTDARDDRPGAFEDADGGTLLLDEVGELPLEVQPKLLRVLDRREVVRLGEHRPRPLDVRVMSATNRDLRDMVARGSFREDLYQRLAQCTIELPPLRAREDDVVGLAGQFLGEFSRGVHESRELSAAAVSKLRAHAWPGNVRELRNVVMRAAQLCPNRVIDASDLELGARRPRGRDGGQDVPLPIEDARRRFDAGYVASLLAFVGGNVSEAARVANMTRRGLQKLIERSGRG